MRIVCGRKDIIIKTSDYKREHDRQRAGQGDPRWRGRDGTTESTMRLIYCRRYECKDRVHNHKLTINLIRLLLLSLLL